MRRKLAVILSVCALVTVATLVFWRWQMDKLASSFQSLPVHSIQTSALASLAPIALDSSVLAGLDPREDRPTIEMYKREPAIVQQQERFVLTWISANNAIKYLGQAAISPGEVVSLAGIKQIPAQYQTDGWNQPFCGSIDGKTAVLISSGGHGPLACQHLEQTAVLARKTIQTKKLARLRQDIFVIVRHNWKSDEDPEKSRESLIVRP